MKVVCSQSEKQLLNLRGDVKKVLLFARTNDGAIGNIGTAVRETLERHKHRPEPKAWDFVALALSVYVADQLIHRNTSSDGWTREIELTVSVPTPRSGIRRGILSTPHFNSSPPTAGASPLTQPPNGMLRRKKSSVMLKHPSAYYQVAWIA